MTPWTKGKQLLLQWQLEENCSAFGCSGLKQSLPDLDKGKKGALHTAVGRRLLQKHPQLKQKNIYISLCKQRSFRHLIIFFLGCFTRMVVALPRVVKFSQCLVNYPSINCSVNYMYQIKEETSESCTGIFNSRLSV